MIHRTVVLCCAVTLGFAGALPASAQFFVSGQLLDEYQQPVSFASIALADGRTGTASNEVGEFSLRVTHRCRAQRGARSDAGGAGCRNAGRYFGFT